MQIQAHLWKKRKQTPSFLVFHQQVSCIRWARPPIKLDRIIYFTQNYPTFLFFQAGIYALFQTTLFALDYPVFQNIYQVTSNSI